MDADQQAGLAGIAMLVHDLLWWGGLVGALVLVRLSLVAARTERVGRSAAHEAAGQPRHAVPAAVSVGTEVRPGGGSRGAAAAASSPVPPTASDADRLLIVAGATAAASGVHAVMVLGHAGTGSLVPLFFAAVAAVQAWQSWRLLVSPSSHLLLGVVAVDVALLLVWAASRTVGLLGPAEAVGPWDSAVVVWQAMCVVVGVRLLRCGRRQLRPPPYAPHRWGAGVQVVLALTLLTLLLLPGAGHG
jgi:hypothetical protein